MPNPFQIIRGILEAHEVAKIIKDANKVKFRSVPIHGFQRSMLQLEKIFSSNYIAHIFNLIRSKIPFPVSGGHDCSVVWTEPGSEAQDWHMDSLQNFPVMTILLNAETPTEFLDINYHPNFIPQIFEYPLCWTKDHSNILKPEIQLGDGILFNSNTIHRGPKVTTDQNTRMCLFVSFRTTVQLNPSTEYVYSNWEWLDEHFHCKDLTIRSFALIDFIIENPYLLDLYPEDIDGVAVRQSIKHQINDRLLNVNNFFANKCLYDITQSETSSHSLVVLQKCTKHSIWLKCFHRSKAVQKVTEYEFWTQCKPKLITEKNISQTAYGGFSFQKTQPYLQKIEFPIIVQTFSHRLNLPNELSVPLSINATKLKPVFVHPKLKYSLLTSSK